MPKELTALIGNIIAQAPLVVLVCYLWFQDRKDKLKQIEFLRGENSKNTKLLENFTAALDKLSLSLELIKDRLR